MIFPLLGPLSPYFSFPKILSASSVLISPLLLLKTTIIQLSFAFDIFSSFMLQICRFSFFTFTLVCVYCFILFFPILVSRLPSYLSLDTVLDVLFFNMTLYVTCHVVLRHVIIFNMNPFLHNLSCLLFHTYVDFLLKFPQQVNFHLDLCTTCSGFVLSSHIHL